MAAVEVNGEKFGWGGDVRDLPTDSGAYGPRILKQSEAKALCDAILETGEWVPFSKTRLEERQVFLFKDGEWRRPLHLVAHPGQILQVKPKTAGLAPPRV